MGEFFVISFFVGTLLFVFPIFVGADLYLDVRENRAWFALSVFGLRLLGGYGEILRDGIAVHLTKRFAYFMPFAKMRDDTRKYFEIADGFQLYKFHQIVETGGADKIYGIFIAAALQAAGGAAFGILRTRYPFLSLKNGTVLSEKPCLKVSIKTVTIMSGLVVTLAIAKKILEALLNWIRNKKLTASWNAQQSSS